ncbi:hypothetical protein [Rhodanobacter caeni]|uniref:Lipoprotein n=1 Tax=Rhodanobacter caeni TaxID=657654 RepID=A0ABN0UGZ4_9GAMM
MKTIALSLLCLSALAGCSGSPAPPPGDPPQPQASSPFDTLKANEQRVRDVQKTVDKHAAEQRKRIDAATQ